VQLLLGETFVEFEMGMVIRVAKDDTWFGKQNEKQPNYS
jgi:hypothetical protein